MKIKKVKKDKKGDVMNKMEKLIWKVKEIVWRNEEGIGVVEMILILVVLIGLVLIFKSQLTALVSDIFETITSESSSV